MTHQRCLKDPYMCLQAITYLQSKAFSSKFMRLCSQALCKNVSPLVSRGHNCIDAFSCSTKWRNRDARVERCLIRVLLAESCWVTWTTAELSQKAMYGGLGRIISLNWPYKLKARWFPHWLAISSASALDRATRDCLWDCHATKFDPR